MIRLLTDSSLPDLHQYFKPPEFEVTLFDGQTEDSDALLAEALNDFDGLICRSTFKVNPAHLHPTALKCIATASSGTDHLPTEALAQFQIQTFNAKGANAKAVVNYMLSVFAALDCRPPQKVGIMGLGQVGSRLYHALCTLGFEVIGYDPLLSHPNIQLPEIESCKIDALYDVDMLCIHANLHHQAPHATFRCIDKAFLGRLKPGVILINAARGGIVDETALLHTNQIIHYCTDVYLNEPDISKDILQFATLCTPHIAGHSVEAKKRAVSVLHQAICKTFDVPHTVHPKDWANQPKASPKDYAALLSHYDPRKETALLKASIETNTPKTAFLQLRKQHQHRQEFDWHQLGHAFNSKD